jgi:hypothetical protein
VRAHCNAREIDCLCLRACVRVLHATLHVFARRKVQTSSTCIYLLSVPPPIMRPCMCAVYSLASPPLPPWKAIRQRQHQAGDAEGAAADPGWGRVHTTPGPNPRGKTGRGGAVPKTTCPLVVQGGFCAQSTKKFGSRFNKAASTRPYLSGWAGRVDSRDRAVGCSASQANPPRDGGRPRACKVKIPTPRSHWKRRRPPGRGLHAPRGASGAPARLAPAHNGPARPARRTRRAVGAGPGLVK